MKENTIANLSKKIQNKEISIRELVSLYLKKAKADNYNAFIEIFNDIDTQIERAEKMLDSGNATPLTGIPIAIKDNILYKGHIASSSSLMLKNYVASYDSTVVKKLLEAGAVIIGRTNMDEFAMGSSTETSAYGKTLNPVDTTRVPGGSSGGSAAVVAGDLVVASLGSDTAGSIRQPAAYTGIVGLLPTYGNVSRHGLIAMGSSLDVIGPMTKTVEDAKILFDLIKGKDEFDSTSLESEKVEKELKNKIAIPKGVRESNGLSKDIKIALENTISILENSGFKIEEVELPHFDDALRVYYIISPAEVSSNLARFDGVRFGDRIEGDNLNQMYSKTRGSFFGKEVRRRILLGTYILSHGYYDAYYNKAVALREIIRKEIEDTLSSYDAILIPTTPTAAFKLGSKSDNPVEMYLEDLFSVPANIAHHPALAVPVGKNEEGLPLGIQFIGARFQEDTLFKLGTIVEKNTL